MNDTASWAVVAQQALEMGQSAMTEIVTAIKGIAPEVWEILMRQVYAEAIAPLVGIILAIPILAFFFKSARKCRANTEDYGTKENWAIASWIAAAFIGVGITCFIGFAVRATMTFINPEYYAIQKFFAIASGGGL